MTAIFKPSRFVNKWFNNVVFPLPRNPDSTVTGNCFIPPIMIIVLKNLLRHMSEINIDAELVKKGHAELSRTEEQMVEMQNGCICCTLREDLLVEVKRLALEQKYDCLVIESTGISEPLPVYLNMIDANSEEYVEIKSEMESSAEWDPVWGDKGNKLVFIGQDFDKVQLEQDLRASLATDTELARNEYTDPFPQWKEMVNESAE